MRLLLQNTDIKLNSHVIHGEDLSRKKHCYTENSWKLGQRKQTAVAVVTGYSYSIMISAGVKRKVPITVLTSEIHLIHYSYNGYPCDCHMSCISYCLCNLKKAAPYTICACILELSVSYCNDITRYYGYIYLVSMKNFV